MTQRRRVRLDNSRHDRGLGGGDGGRDRVGMESSVGPSPTGARVVTCMYDGTHGVWPDQPGADAFIWWFFNRSKRVTLGAT